MTIEMTLPRDYKTFKPAAQAFSLAYLSSTGPKALSILFSLLRKDGTFADAGRSLVLLFRQALRPNRFPTFCAILIGGSTLLQGPLYNYLSLVTKKSRAISSRLSQRDLQVLARFFAAVISSALSFHLINKTTDVPQRSYATVPNDIPEKNDGVSSSENKVGDRKSKIPPGMPPLRSDGFVIPSPINAMGIPLAGKSMDLTIFASVRALDTLMQFLPPPSNPKLRRVWQAAAKIYIPLLFITSTTTIMHAFFYTPVRLPRTYVSWIRRVAQLDERLIQALREARYGNFIYGKDTGIAPLLGSMCKDLGLPEEWGDPAKSIPVPCDLVHQGSGPSCEKHALLRLLRSMKAAMGVYAPLQAFILLRRFRTKKTNRQKAVIAALIDALRSSTFLGAFIALFYYGVCLSRTRLGPKLFSYNTITPQMWDSGLCIFGGCAACGWSIFVELPRRRIELMLFVLPRAVAVWLPRRYDRQERWKEHVIFTLSAAIVLTAAQQWPGRVRGVFGSVLKGVLTA